MKYFDIMKDFSQIVSEKLNEHCMVFTEHMGGSQGEIAKIDYVDLAGLSACPHHLYRVLLEKENLYLDQEFGANPLTTVILSIRYYDHVEGHHSVWNNDGKVVFKKTYYKIDKDAYTCNRQEAEDAVTARIAQK